MDDGFNRVFYSFEVQPLGPQACAVNFCVDCRAVFEDGGGHTADGNASQCQPSERLARMMAKQANFPVPEGGVEAFGMAVRRRDGRLSYCAGCQDYSSCKNPGYLSVALTTTNCCHRPQDRSILVLGSRARNRPEQGREVRCNLGKAKEIETGLLCSPVFWMLCRHDQDASLFRTAGQAILPFSIVQLCYYRLKLMAWMCHTGRHAGEAAESPCGVHRPLRHRAVLLVAGAAVACWAVIHSGQTEEAVVKC